MSHSDKSKNPRPEAERRAARSKKPDFLAASIEDDDANHARKAGGQIHRGGK
jgi:hypothetical protein